MCPRQPGSLPLGPQCRRGKMAIQIAPRFNWGLRTLASLGIGASMSFLFISIGATGWLAPKLFEILLAPGFKLATSVYGGLHGGEPILLGLFVNTLVYSAIFLLVMWVRFRRSMS